MTSKKLNYTIILLLLSILSSCEENKFKVDDCIAKPDMVGVYKITAITSENYQVVELSSNQQLSLPLGSDYFMEKCPESTEEK